MRDFHWTTKNHTSLVFHRTDMKFKIFSKEYPPHHLSTQTLGTNYGNSFRKNSDHTLPFLSSSDSPYLPSKKVGPPCIWLWRTASKGIPRHCCSRNISCSFRHELPQTFWSCPPTVPSVCINTLKHNRCQHGIPQYRNNSMRSKTSTAYSLLSPLCCLEWSLNRYPTTSAWIPTTIPPTLKPLLVVIKNKIQTFFLNQYWTCMRSHDTGSLKHYNRSGSLCKPSFPTCWDYMEDIIVNYTVLGTKLKNPGHLVHQDRTTIHAIHL